ncbi:COP23 domain-containing protein [Zarconia navalis]|uniref:COP23 domain-containing protein n=1 Tax=Zarconia navalis TaxID=2992134 RepID=UPI0021F89DA7|nr:COP23 domain-containing protein [Zarconia navalis]
MSPRQQAQLPQQSEERPIPEEVKVETERFSCELVDSEYTVMYHPQSQPGRSYAWATPTALGGGWTPERRCNEIARRLEFYRPDGLVELGTGIENEYDIICVTTQADASCRIVLTVPPGQDPQQTRDLVFQNIVTADSGQSTAPVSALTGNGEDLDLLEEVLGIDVSDIEVGTRNPSTGINLQPFLDAADGGTGEMLDEGISTSPNPKLNPENFR